MAQSGTGEWLYFVRMFREMSLHGCQVSFRSYRIYTVAACQYASARHHVSTSRRCMLQIRAAQAGLENLNLPSAEMQAQFQAAQQMANGHATDRPADLEWEAWMRLLDNSVSFFTVFPCGTAHGLRALIAAFSS